MHWRERVSQAEQGLSQPGALNRARGLFQTREDGIFSCLRLSQAAFNQGQVISNQGRDFKLLATKMTAELFQTKREAKK